MRENSVVESLKSLVLSFDGDKMNDDTNQSIFNFITCILGEESANVFAQRCECVKFDEYNNPYEYRYRGDPIYLWRTIIANAFT